MIVVYQRVTSARVSVAEGAGAGHDERIGVGFVALVGVEEGDTESESLWCADKCARLRVFNDDDGKMNRSVIDTRGEAMAISQFTLAGDAKKGNRPSFVRAAHPDVAAPLVEAFARRLEQEHGLRVARGVFGASMAIELTNDGPVTIIIHRRPGD